MMLLQELLAYQDKFGCHYTSGLEGCGPTLEADIRSSYYTLIGQLVAACRSVFQASASRSVTFCPLVPAFAFVLFGHRYEKLDIL